MRSQCAGSVAVWPFEVIAIFTQLALVRGHGSRFEQGLFICSDLLKIGVFCLALKAGVVS